MGNRHREGQARCNPGKALLGVDRFAEAVTLLEDAVKIFQEGDGLYDEYAATAFEDASGSSAIWISPIWRRRRRST